MIMPPLSMPDYAALPFIIFAIAIFIDAAIFDTPRRR